MKTSHAYQSPFAATGRLRRWPRCATCRWRPVEVYLDTVRLDQRTNLPTPATTWGLCRTCHKAVLREMIRADLRSPDRLLVAVGMVAADRAPRRYVRRVSAALQRPRTWVEADMLLLLMLMFFTISGLIVGVTALALAASHLF